MKTLLILITATAVFAAKENIETPIKLQNTTPLNIEINNNDTDYIVEIEDFICPNGFHCQIELEIYNMLCDVNNMDTDPTYIWFEAIQGTDGFTDFKFEDKEFKCGNIFGTSIKPLNKFDLKKLKIQPVGSKWESGKAKVNLTAKIAVSKLTFFDESIQEQQISLVDSTVREFRLKEDNLNICANTTGNTCSIAMIISKIDPTLNDSCLKATFYSKDKTIISTSNYCKSISTPTDPYTFDQPIHSIVISNSPGLKAVATFNIQVQTKSTCPEGYFDCMQCGAKHNGPSLCIRNEFVCDKRTHCGLPCFADELLSTCPKGSDDKTEKYSTDLYNIYTFILKLFLWTTGIIFILVAVMSTITNFKIESIRNQLINQSGLIQQYLQGHDRYNGFSTQNWMAQSNSPNKTHY